MTSTAVSTDTRPAPAAKPSVKVGGPIGALAPQSVDEAFRLADALAKAGDMIPQAFRDQPMKIMAAIAKGMEVGLAPMQALASIAVINGRPTVWGDAIPALVQRAGHHLDVEYEGQGDGLVAVATLTRGDSGRRIVRRFGVADAKRAGLLGKQGPWTQYTARMCGMRARTWAARDGAADALMGLQVHEEVADHGPDQARDVTPQAPGPRKGGVVYADAEVVEEIHDGEVIADDPTDADRARAAEEAEAAIRERDAAEAGE